ncbi:MAG: UvrD-helicase domain-containing protein [Candidatus Sungiibacteriota bacterium]
MQNEELLAGLNEKQREAVITTEGPLLILAGPGSGKTRVLTHRVAYLISHGTAPDQILAVTFTNKAAEEMKLRIGKLISGSRLPAYGHPFIGTFHAFCVRILRVHAGKIGHQRSFTIFDTDDALSVMKDAGKELGINPKQFPPGMLLHTISGLKNELTTAEQYAERMGLADLFPRTLHESYVLYQKKLRDANAMDFDDLLCETVRLFNEHPTTLAQYQNQFRYIHVDEYQDVNTSQYALTRQLAITHRNIAVVGDDAQAIYSFRGADYRNILNFEKDWPDAKVIILGQNYRSTQVILDAAAGVIAKNRMQKDKTLTTDQDRGELIRITALPHERAEAQFTTDTIKELLRNGTSRSDIVVLYRTNAQSRAIEDALIKENIPYKIVGSVRFYQRKEVKDILAYVRFALNRNDLVSLKRIINVPTRGIGKQALLKYLAWHRAGHNSAALDGKSTPALVRFNEIMDDLARQATTLSAVQFLKYLVRAIRYREYLKEGEQADERWENVEELVNLAKKYDDLPPPEGLQKLLEDVALMSDQDEIAEGESMREVVHLMTFHAAKGLEFRIVFMVGMEEGIFPHARSLFNPSELEEERRLCYVGLTRAKEKVFLSFALSRTHFGASQINPPSRFLGEIPEHLLETIAEDAEILMD